MMTLTVEAESIPVMVDQDGAARVAGTRVTLDTIVSFYNQGLSAEDIRNGFPSVSLADVYTTIGYYLRHRSEVEAYLYERKRSAAEVRRENEARFDPRGIRERLLARREASQNAE